MSWSKNGVSSVRVCSFSQMIWIDVPRDWGVTGGAVIRRFGVRVEAAVRGGGFSKRLEEVTLDSYQAAFVTLICKRELLDGRCT